MSSARMVGPSQTASHAAFLACQAAREAVRNGASEQEAREVHDRTYAAALRGEVAAA